MRIPEFTAEVSLGKAEEGYILKSAGRAEPGTILPQLRIKALCDNEGNCIHLFQKEGRQISVLQAFPPNKGSSGRGLLG